MLIETLGANSLLIYRSWAVLIRRRRRPNSVEAEPITPSPAFCGTMIFWVDIIYLWGYESGTRALFLVYTALLSQKTLSDAHSHDIILLQPTTIKRTALQWYPSQVLSLQ